MLVVCRVLSLWHSANSLFAERPIKKHSVKSGTLGKEAISGSAGCEKKRNEMKHDEAKGDEGGRNGGTGGGQVVG